MNRLMHWIRAARPKTLPAAAIPVAIGGALAHAGAQFNLLPWLICLVFALLIQIGTNFAKDYYDYIKGADDARRIGPDRAVASGWIAPPVMQKAMIGVFAAAFFTGCTLIPWGGPWLLVIGVLSILCGIAYTGGPYPLGYNGLGDVFVFLFFGWVATGFTVFVQAGSFALELAQSGGVMWTWLAGVVPGALATNLLVVNNIRDEPLDREAGKRTLAVRFGRSFGLRQFALLLVLAFAVPLGFALFAGQTGCLLVLLAGPIAWSTYRKLAIARGKAAFDTALSRCAILLVLVGGLFSLGLLIPG